MAMKVFQQEPPQPCPHTCGSHRHTRSPRLWRKDQRVSRLQQLMSLPPVVMSTIPVLSLGALKLPSLESEAPAGQTTLYKQACCTCNNDANPTHPFCCQPLLFLLALEPQTATLHDSPWSQRGPSTCSTNTAS